jgi:hypothetical protein
VIAVARRCHARDIHPLPAPMNPSPLPADRNPGAADAPAKKLRASNLRTAAILLSIALTFFVGVIAAKWMGTPQVSIGVLGSAVLLFLLVAIGRNLRK